MNNPFDYRPSAECETAFSELLQWLEELRESRAAADVALLRELDAGKMLGVLIATDDTGARHRLYAFSGQIGEWGFRHPHFVEPVLDYLQRDGHFKCCEKAISRLNQDISTFENESLADAEQNYRHAQAEADAVLAKHKEQYKEAKAAREQRRSSGIIEPAEAAELIRQSQYEKAELRRLKARLKAALEPAAQAYTEAQTKLRSLKEQRRMASEELQTWLFSNFHLLNARGESRNLLDIFADTPQRIPPSGAGECCAPKLLQAAYSRGWMPVEMAEYWYGHPKGGEVRRHGEHYPACRGKCLPILSWMLQGLDVAPLLGAEQQPILTAEPHIIYEGEWFCVVEKPSGMLSVPGKGAADSVQAWLQRHYGAERDVRPAHRLDRDTSGLLVATFGTDAYRLMQHLFATRRVHKCYVALLSGDYRTAGLGRRGRIVLPLAPDILDRPRQRVDHTHGYPAVTDYEFTDCQGGVSRVTFHPLTGRTHQLRVHAASSEGLGLPIAGDPLYGHHGGTDAPRLRLHAAELSFTFPLDGRQYSFHSPTPF